MARASTERVTDRGDAGEHEQHTQDDVECVPVRRPEVDQGRIPDRDADHQRIRPSLTAVEPTEFGSRLQRPRTVPCGPVPEPGNGTPRDGVVDRPGETVAPLSPLAD